MGGSKHGQYIAEWSTKGRRFIFPHGEVMIHQPSGGGQGTSARLEIMECKCKKQRNGPKNFS